MPRADIRVIVPGCGIGTGVLKSVTEDGWLEVNLDGEGDRCDEYFTTPLCRYSAGKTAV